MRINQLHGTQPKIFVIVFLNRGEGLIPLISRYAAWREMPAAMANLGTEVCFNANNRLTLFVRGSCESAFIISFISKLFKIDIVIKIREMLKLDYCKFISAGSLVAVTPRRNRRPIRTAYSAINSLHC